MKQLTKGKPKTKLHRERISLGLKEKAVAGKLVVIDNGTDIVAFTSYAEAARYIGCTR